MARSLKPARQSLALLPRKVRGPCVIVDSGPFSGWRSGKHLHTGGRPERLVYRALQFALAVDDRVRRSHLIGRDRSLHANLLIARFARKRELKDEVFSAIPGVVDLELIQDFLLVAKHGRRCTGRSDR